MRKTYHNSPDSPSTENVKDIIRFGDPDQWQLVCKASSKEEQWLKSTKAFNLPNGVMVQVTTQQGGEVAEAVTFIPGIFFDQENQFQPFPVAPQPGGPGVNPADAGDSDGGAARQ